MEYGETGNPKALLEIVQYYVNSEGSSDDIIGDTTELHTGIHILGKKLQKAELSLKVTEQQLLRSRERYNNMVAEVEDYAILLLDLDGNILNWNKGAEYIKGYLAHEVLGRNFRIFYTEKDRAEHLPEKLIGIAISEGRVQNEGWRVCKSGKTFWGIVTITALHDNQGNINGFLKITRDLTEKKKAEDNKRLYIERLENKNMELEQFTYIASHDLQEPLRSMSSLIELLLEEYSGRFDENADTYLRFILQSSNRMSQLITGLLDYSRIGKERIPEKVDCNEVMETVKVDLRKAIQDSKAIIRAKDLPVVDAYPMELKLLFQNLLSNAIKFKKAEQPPTIDISASKTDDGWLFSFCDDGIGMEDRFKEKIFEIFQRLHSKQAYEGTGIGLAHCKKIVTLHNGKIWVESAPGRGSQFYFTLSV
ncbi:PAS domain S-box-containing protein [Chitinophaga sp. CF118]|uniref:sensor histidine kinase n=1 Tax=Chitinophaga sp. CF118 TaxID=1884367 RepID=UPI0008DFECEC|nr:ATP-binding protein [Chitinophaga sp. CF118]SFD77625.1 PAS domain S-box-containing protein [Chitinophaga sp. CF118]